MTRIIVKRCLLQNILDKKGWTQLDLSIKSGLTTTQINEWINNKRGMSLKNAILIAYILNIHVEDLYEWHIR